MSTVARYRLSGRDVAEPCPDCEAEAPGKFRLRTIADLHADLHQRTQAARRARAIVISSCPNQPPARPPVGFPVCTKRHRPISADGKEEIRMKTLTYLDVTGAHRRSTVWRRAAVGRANVPLTAGSLRSPPPRGRPGRPAPGRALGSRFDAFLPARQESAHGRFAPLTASAWAAGPAGARSGAGVPVRGLSRRAIVPLTADPLRAPLQAQYRAACQP